MRISSTLSSAALLAAALLGAWSCNESTCEDACKDGHDDCRADPPGTEQQLSCDRQYDQCLVVCAGRPRDETEDLCCSEGTVLRPSDAGVPTAAKGSAR